MGLRKLPHDDIRRIHKAAIEARLDRAPLLAGLPVGIHEGIRIIPDPSGQLLVDLDHLNGFESTAAEPPIVTWLKNAVSLSPARAQVSIFESALRALEADASKVLNTEQQGAVGSTQVGGSLPPTAPCRLVSAAALGPPSALVLASGLVATGHRGGAAALWDLATGERRGLLVGHGATVTALALSTVERRLAVCTSNGIIRVHDVATGRQERPLRTPGGGLMALAFDADAELLFGITLGGAILAWDLSSGRKIWTADAISGSPVALAVGASFLRFVTIDRDRASVFQLDRAAIGSSAPRVTKTTTVEHSGLGVAALDNSGESLLTIDGDGCSRVWSLASGRLLTEDAVGLAGVPRIAIGVDGRRCAIATRAETFTSTVHGTGEWRPLDFHGVGITSLAPSDAGEIIWSGAADGSVRRLRVLTGEVDVARPGRGQTLRALVPSPGGHFVVTVVDRNTVELWDGVSGEWDRTLFALEERICALAMTRDGSVVLSGLEDGWIDLYSVTSRRHSRVQAHSAPITALSVDPANPRRFASGAEDGTIHSWNDLGSIDERSGMAQDGAISSLAFSPSGKLLASGATSGEVILWQPDEAVRRFRVVAHHDLVAALAFSPNGNVLATGSWDGTIRLWNARSGSSLRRLTGHANGVTSLCFDRRGRALVSAGMDGTTHIWNVETGRVVASTVIRSDVQWVTFLSDGTFVGSASFYASCFPELCRAAAPPARDPAAVARALRGLFLESESC